MSRLTYTAKAVTTNYPLETLTFRSTYYIHIDYILKDVDLDSVAQLVVSRETFELGQVSHWGYSCLFKVTHERLCCMLLSGFLETELKSIVAVMFTCLDLSNHTRTQFDNSAWRIYTIGTENGSHSDFLS